MKRLIIILCSLVALTATAQTSSTHKKTAGQIASSRVATSQSTASSTSSGSRTSVSSRQETSGERHDYVDLGLPSGTLWATCNIGANSPEEYGEYFAWGETTPQSSRRYSWDSYKYCHEAWNMSKYCLNSFEGDVDNRKELLPSDDAATVNWGSEWKMPTDKQVQELEKYTTSKWTSLNGVYGRKMTSKMRGHTGKSIFLPAAGKWDEGEFAEEADGGYYWSSSLIDWFCSSADDLSFGKVGICTVLGSARYRGESVRPVRAK